MKMKPFEELFRASGGQPVKYEGKIIQLFDLFPAVDGQFLRLQFESAHSAWRQGVLLSTDEGLNVNNKSSKDIVLWYDTAPREVMLQVHTRKGEVLVVNVWDSGDGCMDQGHNGAAMQVEETATGRRYKCNDGVPDDDFDDLVFQIDIVTPPSGHRPDSDSTIRKWSWTLFSILVFVVAVIIVIFAWGSNDEWSEIAATDHRFKVKVPGKAQMDSRKAPDGRIITSWKVTDGKITSGGEFTASVSKSQIANDAMIKASLDVARDAVLEGFKAKLLDEADFLSQQGRVVGRKMNVEIADLGLKGRILYVVMDNRAYQLQVFGQPTWKGWEKADRFFDSFELLP